MVSTITPEYIKYTEEPLLLLSYDTNQNKFIINEQALKVIQSINEPISIVSMIGKKSIGKSFLLNKFLLLTNNGFEIHHKNLNHSAYKVYIWGKPLKGKTLNETNVSVLILDFDGFIDNDPISTKLLTISILISSCLLSNTNNGCFNDDSLDMFHDIIQIPKSIRLTNKDNQNELENYSNYFPSLIWLSRDDNMIRIDQNDNRINMKEYMEDVLIQQNKQANGVDNRNRIKAYIRALFKDRDLISFVKPLSNKGMSLSNLPNLDLNDIQPEFLESIMELRKKVLGKAKVKMINDIMINGVILTNLIRSYIDNINNGIISNIENIWENICKNICQKALNEAINLYGNLVTDDVLNKLPMIEIMLKNIHKSLKKRCIENFKSQAITNNISKSYEQELYKQLKFKYNKLIIKNQEEGNKVSSSFLKREYSTIDKKLKNNEYESYQEFESDIDLFYEYFMEKGPNFPNKQLMILDFLLGSLKINTHGFIKNLEKRLDEERISTNMMKAKYEDSINNLKSNSLDNNYKLQLKITELEAIKGEYESKIHSLSENIGNLKTEKMDLEMNLSNNWEKDRLEQKKIIQDLNNKLIDHEDKMKQIKEKYMIYKGEFDQKKLLLEQKIEFLEKSTQDATKRENETMQAMGTLRIDMNTQLKEVMIKYDKIIKEMQVNIDNQQEKIHSYEETIENKDAFIDNLMKKTSQTILEKEDRIEDLKTKLKNYEKLIQGLKDDGKYELQNSKLLFQSHMEELNKRNEEANLNLKQKEEYLKGVKTRLEKENAILNQKINFLESDIESLRNQLNESKKNNEQIIKSVEVISTKASRGYDIKQMNELKDLHNKEIKELYDKYENIKNKLQNQVDELNTKKNELELMIKIKESDYNTKELKFKEELERIDLLRQKLSEQNKILEAEKSKILKEYENRYINKIKNLEKQIEEKDMINDKNIKEMNERSELYISQLKSVFELEKQRLEKRIQEEKDRYEKQIATQIEEFEEKLKSEQVFFSEEIENLTEELKEKDRQYQLEVQNYAREINLRQKSIESLEQHLKEAKENFNSLYQKHTIGFEHNLETFNQERKNLTCKIESLNLEITKLEKENFSLQQRIEQMEINFKKKEEAYENLLKEHAEEKMLNLTKIEETKQKLQSITNEYMEMKMGSAKEIALNAQQMDFLKKKIDQLKEQNEDIIREYEEKLKIQKQEQQTEFNEYKGKMHIDYQGIEEKYETKKKLLKELQINYQKDISNLQKENAILQEKLNLYQCKKNEKDEEENNHIQALNFQITKLKEVMNNDKKGYLQEIEKVKKTIQDLQNQNIELNTNYERDKALWEAKIQFIEQQRDQAKNDFSDLQKKFDMTVQSIQKFRNIPNDGVDSSSSNSSNSQNELISSLETRYKKKIEELNESYQAKIQDINERKNRLEKELKLLSDKILMDNYSKMGNNSMIESKLCNLMDIERQLLHEIEEVKKDRDMKIIEYQNKLDNETEYLRQKLKDYDIKYKDCENKRNLLIFEFEKERTKWNVEKEFLTNQRNELQDIINKIDNKKEILLRENEKLKNENKLIRKNNHICTCASALNTLSPNIALNSSTNSSSSGFKRLNGNYFNRSISPLPIKSSSEKENQGFSAFLTNPRTPVNNKNSLKSNNKSYHKTNISVNLSNNFILTDQDQNENSIPIRN